ncbi:MAG TPA: hypothetical protein VHF27_10260 [Acidimicrobiales bacterium]|nr:hypothetical protein [Acidimicrobiales bacterium]
MTVPVGAGPPGAGVKVATSVTVEPGLTSEALVEAWVTSVTGWSATANRSAGSPQPTGVVIGA